MESQEIEFQLPPITSDREDYLYAYVDALAEALAKLVEH